MSALAKPTGLDLMRDDPKRLLDVSEAAALLHVKAKRFTPGFLGIKFPIARSVRSCDHRGELIAWAKGQQQNTSKATPNGLPVVK